MPKVVVKNTQLTWYFWGGENMETRKEKMSSIDDLLREKEKIEQSITDRFSEYVTIMFTDIAGYTRFVETHGDLNAKSLLLCHNEMVFDCIKKNQGKVIKTIGDAVMASFEKPLDAVKASVATQTALKVYNETASPQKKINIRIGLNTGNAIKDKDDYFGDAVNVAARIESAGSAGQVLVSQSVFNAVKEEDSILIRHHGQKAVKGKSEPLELYRVFLSQDELTSAENEAQKARESKASQENSDRESSHAENGHADFASHWQGADKTMEEDSISGTQESDRSHELINANYSALPFENGTQSTRTRSAHRFDLIWKFSLPVMICLGLFIYLYPQLAPSEKTTTLLNQYIQAFNLLRSGDVAGAKTIFLGFGEDNAKCQEGLAAIAYKNNAYDQAKAFSDRSIAADSTVFYPRVIKGNLFFDTGKIDEARKNYSEALNYESPIDWQKGELYFRLGRLSSMEKDPEKALTYYEKAVGLDRTNADIITAKGVVYEKLGQMDNALMSYDAALKIDPDHPMANTFYRQIKRDMELAENKEKQARVDALVSDLIATMEKRKQGGATSTGSGEVNGGRPLDVWTSRPVTLFMAGRERSGAFSLQEGEDQFFELALLEALGHSGKISIVDRALLDKLLGELKLGASALADPATALQLGRLVSARLIGNLKFLGYAGETKIFLKFIETETSSIKINLSGSVGQDIAPDILAEQFAKEIIEKVPAVFPIRGRISEIDDSAALLNIGTSQGVETGMILRVFPAEAVTNSLKRKTVGAIKVIEVMPDACRGEIVKGKDIVDATHVVEAFSS